MNADFNFIYTIKPVRSDFNDSSTPEEDRIMSEHFAYLQSLLGQGKLLLAGPCLDATFGVVIFSADSEEEAEQIMSNDPAVRGGVMIGEVHPFKVSLLHTCKDL